MQRSSFSTSLPWPAIVLSLIVWLMAVAYGFQYLVMADKAAHLAYFRVATIPFVALVVIMTVFALRSPDRGGQANPAPAWLGVTMMSISWVLACYFYSSKLSPLPWLGLAIVPPVIAAALRWRMGERAAVALFLLAALGVYLYLIARYPHDVVGGDMLQIIGFAATDLLQGNSPFVPYFTVSNTEVPFGYWPGVWLPYVPLVALGLDMRVLNLVLYGALVVLFWKRAGGGEHAAQILGVALLPFMLSPQILQMVLSGHLWLYWLMLAGMMWFIVERRYLLAAILFGLCLASRPTVLFIAAPILAYVWSRENLRMVGLCMSVVLAVLLVMNLPFFLLYGDVFVQNSFARMIGFGHELTHFSLAGILQGLGFNSLGRLLQAAVAIIAIATIIYRRDLRKGQFVMFCGVIYVWEVLFASYATRYVYFPGFFLFALGFVMSRPSLLEIRQTNSVAFGLSTENKPVVAGPR